MTVPFPEYILCDTLWDFHEQYTFSSQAAFEEAVLRHHQEAEEYAPDIKPEECWQPTDVVLRSPRVVISYFSDPPGEGEVEHEAEFVSNNGESFTAGELLYKLHNAAVEQLRDSGHRWFEGFELDSIGEQGVPVYRLRLGS